MVQISKRKVSDRVLENIFELFFKLIAKERNKNDFNKLFEELFSYTERIMIAKRVAIMYLRLKKIDQFTISKTLKVSSGTVAKYSIIAEGSDGVVPGLQRLLLKDEIVGLLEDTMNIVLAPGIPGGHWATRWERVKARERKKRTGI
ncbi:hypothetical protein A3D80_04620 [Candidatus Roizmanbacteria bacterium RIFCSPHIGHO2_02_FULL_40_13b]|uniref:TrpR like protein, YerC/YecD n=1 Tax=Candidatus Roizmanbacteria bacterium RIFCSPHIGHO2_01_FULL_39_24 TaxID=1802032 RepID=A0A1F7GEY7_9BACT|nr:MAG: hypothetical protein A2799_01690 [Candidatus Roizmanbacteria bacterium RIFCSPHIGHO2_01_FULL_39_24]OGK27887.1 MAG: hypothetical protein A3D80_04620 [Candidatus Roizmanbacteria bacterium RIFCSPHIGHO2_02_FULL_40_13b]